LNLLNKDKEDTGAIFRSMVEATGKESANVLRDIAEGKTGVLDMDRDIVQVEEEDGDASLA
jgi:hypothetical protein